MESLIKAGEQYQALTKEEEINVDLFNKVMKKSTVWDYCYVSRERFT